MYLFPELHPLRSLVTSVLGHFGPSFKGRNDRGPKWPRTEVDAYLFPSVTQILVFLQNDVRTFDNINKMR